MQCYFPVEGGTLVTGVFARIHRRMVDVELEREEEHPDNECEVFYPVLDVEIRGVYRIPVKGGVTHEPEFADTGGASFITEAFIESFASADESEREAIKAAAKVRSQGDKARRDAGLKHLMPDCEWSFEDAEEVILDFIREVVAEFGVDVKGLQEALGGEVLTVSEVAEIFGVPRNTVLHWIKTGKLRAFRIGSKWRIERKDLASAVQESKPADSPVTAISGPVSNEVRGNE
jgi:excisionase family DNA binding protein